MSREDNNNNENNKSKKCGKPKKQTAHPYYEISDESLQIIENIIRNPSCYESMHPNLCRKLQ